ncbi:hypothetical protein FRB99_001612 [Tulasnella sp. 403]|nr:hypothetical protein FRB99_001612 [Tulasnella sp. 403]
MFAIHPPRRSDRLPTFHHQRSLPRLPVPPLRESLDRYLKSLEPLLNQAEEKGGEKADVALAKRKGWADEFERGAGKVLQERLVDLDRTSPNNWLNDNFWLKKAYHEWRAPLPVNSNWWLLFQDDKTIPEDVRQSVPPPGQATDWQIRRAAWLIARLLDFKDKLDRQEIHPDSSRTGMWFRRPALSLFNICRLPGIGCDSLTQPPQRLTPAARSVTVFLKDWAYAVEVYDRDGVRIGVGEVERRLWEVVRDVQQRESKGERAVPVGILTADERDTWAKNRERLLSVSPRNRQSTTSIENSLFVLSLDDHTRGPRASTHPDITRPNIDAQVQACGFGGPTGLNRWFDKALTVVVENNGRAGMMGEHSPCDALIPSIIVDYAIAEHIDVTAFEESTTKWTLDGTNRAWERLDWEVDGTLAKEMQGAQQRAVELIADSEPSQLWYSEYGAEWIKNVAKCSPDAYLQMALQLAWYKDQGYMTATYETASTRLFAHGRTDVIRTLSSASRRWVKSMVDPAAKAASRRLLLLEAISAHNGYTRDASVGKACDRHLAALKWLVRQGEKVPALLGDEMFAKSSEWKLSTSGLSAGTRFFGTGFGTVWPDGYGINYLAGPELVKFGIESKASCETTSTQAFKAHVVDSLRQMRVLFEEDEGRSLPKSKL